MSTTHAGTGTGSGGGTGKRDAYQAIGVMVAVATAAGYAVHYVEQREIVRIQEKAATEIAQAKEVVARIEDNRRIVERICDDKVERYKYDMRLTYSSEFERYQREKEEGKKRGGSGGLEKEEKKD